MIKVLVLDDGKYTYVNDRGKASVLRYGETWRDVTGDHFVGALVDELESRDALIKCLYDALYHAKNSEIPNQVVIDMALIEAKRYCKDVQSC